MDEHDEDEETYSLTHEGAEALLEFALGHENEFDDKPLGCVMVAMALAGLTMRDLDLSEDEFDIPLREMPETAEKLRVRLQETITQRIGEAQS